MKIDNYYKFIASSFGFAYFVGLLTGIFIYFVNHTYIPESQIINSFYLTSTFNFKELLTSNFSTALKLALVPFSYLILSVKYGFTHSFLLISPFLGQIKLLVSLIPQILYFITIIIFSSLGLKLIIFIIKEITNNLMFKNKNPIRIQTFNSSDTGLLYISIISLILGIFIQIYLSRVFFIYLINFQLITYLFIIIVYIVLVVVSLYITYKTILSLLKALKEIKF
ncbi:MAG: hypothetical protein V1824_02285 [archaeon]